MQNVIPTAHTHIILEIRSNPNSTNKSLGHPTDALNWALDVNGQPVNDIIKTSIRPLMSTSTGH